MAQRFDVVVVGARCAGSPLAAHLARAGLSVALVDRAGFPSDAHSTHVFQVDAVNALARLGVLDAVLASGAPWLEQVDVRLGEVRVSGEIAFGADDPGPGLCVRRIALDSILVDAARASGAEVRTGTRVVSLLRRGGRVAGVRVQADGVEEELDADLVVGADGAGSTIARLVGARRYNVVPNQRFGYWGYFEGTTWAGPATLVFHRWDDELVIGCPADDGLYLAIVLLPFAQLDAFRADVDANFTGHLGGCPPVAAAIDGARRVDRLQAMMTYPSFFRESAGPGWVLVGDAGHVSDPTPGQGISDALRQVERMVPAIVGGLAGGRSALDEELAKWWRWKDADGAEMHWFASDLGSAAPLPGPVEAALTTLADRNEAVTNMMDVFNHRVAPSAVLTPARILAATGQLLREGTRKRLDVLRDTRDLVVQDRRRRHRNRRPLFATADAPTAPDTNEEVSP